MKVLLLNGSPHEHGSTYTALTECAGVLQAEGIETHIHWIGTKPISGCIACRSCKQSGKCALNDQVNDLLAELDNYDGIVVGSPVHYAGPSGQLCALLDRLFFAYGGQMAGKLAASVVSCRRGGSTAAFDRLNKYPAMNNMVIVGSQYWNQIHGSVAQQAREDAEGLQTMRALGENMAWLLKCIAAGKAANVPMPAYEKRIATNFIR